MEDVAEKMDAEEIGIEQIEAGAGESREKGGAKKTAILVGAAVLCVVIAAFSVSAIGFPGVGTTEQPDTRQAQKSAPAKSKAVPSGTGSSPSEGSGDEARASGGSSGTEEPSEGEGNLVASVDGSRDAGSAAPSAPASSPSAEQSAPNAGSVQGPSAPAPVPDPAPEPSATAPDPAPALDPAPLPDPEPVQPEPPAKHWVYGYKCGSCPFHSTSVAEMDAHQRNQMLAGADHGAYGSWSWEE